jgi:hypothetical protein
VPFTVIAMMLCVWQMSTLVTAVGRVAVDRRGECHFADLILRHIAHHACWGVAETSYAKSLRGSYLSLNI